MNEIDLSLIAEHTAQLKRFNDYHEGEDVLVSCTEAARILGKTPGTISAWLRQGKIRKTTIGVSTGIRLRDLRDMTNPL